MTHGARRTAAALIGGLLFVVAAGPAIAHVTVNPREAAKGGFAKLTFRVPNERDDAGTTKVEVAFPAEHPVENVSVKPQPGWAYSVERSPAGAVTKVTWTGGPIKPGEFDEFDLSMGPLPDDAEQLVFKALQTYESGEVVRWIEEQAAGAEEPEHPAPVLQLVAGDEDEAAGEESDNDATDWAGVVLGGAALVLALAALLARRRPAPAE